MADVVEKADEVEDTEEEALQLEESSVHVLVQEEVAAGLSNLGRVANGQSFAFLNATISGLDLTDISILKEFKNLQKIDVSSNLLKQVSVLGELPHLTSLNASYNHLTAILDFLPPRNLREADLSHNRITEMNDISAHRFLSKLNLDDNEIRMISGVQQCTCLRVLSLNHNFIQEISNLDNLPLRELHLEQNSIELFENMETLTCLQILSVQDNQITSLRGLESLSMLNDLNLKQNGVRSLSEMAYINKLPVLERLVVEGNPVTGLECYRLQLLHAVPGLVVLDDVEVCAEEKVATDNFHDPDHPQYQDTIRHDAQDLPPSLFVSPLNETQATTTEA